MALNKKCARPGQTKNENGRWGARGTVGPGSGPATRRRTARDQRESPLMGRLRDALAAGEDHPSRLCQCGDDCRRRHDAYCADCEMSQVLRLLRAGEPMSILNKTKKLSTVSLLTRSPDPLYCTLR